MLERIREVILPSNDVSDAQLGIVRTRCQVIGGHSVASQQGKVLDVCRGLRLIQINAIVKADLLLAISRHAEPQGERFSRGSTPLALLSRKLSHTCIEQPRALRGIVALT